MENSVQGEPKANVNPAKRRHNRNKNKPKANEHNVDDNTLQDKVIPNIAQAFQIPVIIPVTEEKEPTQQRKRNNKRRHRQSEKPQDENCGTVKLIDQSESEAAQKVKLLEKEELQPKAEVQNLVVREKLMIKENLNEKINEPARKVIENASKVHIEKDIAAMDKDPKSDVSNPKIEKSREEIIAEREAKKLAKQAAKGKPKAKLEQKIDKKVENEVKTRKEVKSAPKQDDIKVETGNVEKPRNSQDIVKQVENLKIESEKKEKPQLTKAERRAIQEAQRAKKEAEKTKKEADGKETEKAKSETKEKTHPSPHHHRHHHHVHKISTDRRVRSQNLHTVKLFNHLYFEKHPIQNILNSADLHPTIVALGQQFAEGYVVGSTARCLAFLKAIIAVVTDYETPPQKEFSRGLEEILNICIAFLQKCRPLSVSMSNALKFIKMHISQLKSDVSDAMQKEQILELIDTYIRDQIEKAAQAISISVQEKISNGDVILTYGCSSLVKHILEEAHRRQINFRAIVVDSRPRHEGQEMMRRLVSQGIDCTCVLINAVSFIMPEVTKILLGAHALLANGSVMARVGTAQIALVAKSYNVPVLVCCETHKFSERVQTDAFVYNEIGNPNDLILNTGTLDNRKNNPLYEWQSVNHLTPLNLHYDVTPPELVTAVVTEVGILPCTSVPVILRIKPSEIGY